MHSIYIVHRSECAQVKCVYDGPSLGSYRYLFNDVKNVCFPGGRKQSIDCRFLLTKEDFLSNFDIFKKVSWLSFSLNS